MRKEKQKRRGLSHIHRSLWNEGAPPSIACLNSFFLFSLKRPVLFSLERERQRERKRERVHRLKSSGPLKMFLQ